MSHLPPSPSPKVFGGHRLQHSNEDVEDKNGEAGQRESVSVQPHWNFLNTSVGELRRRSDRDSVFMASPRVPTKGSALQPKKVMAAQPTNLGASSIFDFGRLIADALSASGGEEGAPLAQPNVQDEDSSEPYTEDVSEEEEDEDCDDNDLTATRSRATTTTLRVFPRNESKRLVVGDVGGGGGSVGARTEADGAGDDDDDDDDDDDYGLVDDTNVRMTKMVRGTDGRQAFDDNAVRKQNPLAASWMGGAWISSESKRLSGFTDDGTNDETTFDHDSSEETEEDDGDDDDDDDDDGKEDGSAVPVAMGEPGSTPGIASALSVGHAADIRPIRKKSSLRNPAKKRAQKSVAFRSSLGGEGGKSAVFGSLRDASAIMNSFELQTIKPMFTYAHLSDIYSHHGVGAEQVSCKKMLEHLRKDIAKITASSDQGRREWKVARKRIRKSMFTLRMRKSAVMGALSDDEASQLGPAIESAGLDPRRLRKNKGAASDSGCHVDTGVSEKVSKPVKIFITGNSANTGDAQEYKDAVLQLWGIAADIGLAAQDIYVIPGNHDVCRDVMKDASFPYRAMFKWLRDHPTSGDVEKSLQDQEFGRILRRRFVNFEAFSRSFSPFAQDPGLIDWPNWTARVPHRDEDKLPVLVVGLNTAILSANGDDNGKVRSHAGQVRDAASLLKTWNRRLQMRREDERCGRAETTTAEEVGLFIPKKKPLVIMLSHHRFVCVCECVCV
eukprot:TRINITY_DN2662_c0_g2_i2.p1 TRINITY_DN2662_c0_g2~~TRINITY_DN2662_c0_g2_i2.p1  ORF type:complete len:725 (+),score=200.55 TRINITY_DN2662_c0_g2_i2:465-2639(+)